MCEGEVKRDVMCGTVQYSGRNKGCQWKIIEIRWGHDNCDGFFYVVRLNVRYDFSHSAVKLDTNRFHCVFSQQFYHVWFNLHKKDLANEIILFP